MMSWQGLVFLLACIIVIGFIAWSVKYFITERKEKRDAINKEADKDIAKIGRAIRAQAEATRKTERIIKELEASLIEKVKSAIVPQPSSSAEDLFEMIHCGNIWINEVKRRARMRYPQLYVAALRRFRCFLSDFEGYSYIAVLSLMLEDMAYAMKTRPGGAHCVEEYLAYCWDAVSFKSEDRLLYLSDECLSMLKQYDGGKMEKIIVTDSGTLL